MKLKSLLSAIQAKAIVVTPEDENREILNVVASDLMSDVLMMDVEHPLLVTSLASDQSLRTANVVGAQAVVIVNDKIPPAGMATLAKELGIPLAASPLRKYEACVALGNALQNAQ